MRQLAKIRHVFPKSYEDEDEDDGNDVEVRSGGPAPEARSEEDVTGRGEVLMNNDFYDLCCVGLQ